MSFFQNLFKPKKSSQNAFKYIVLGGGNSSGYAAREFVAKGIEAGELCIITEEGYVAYERPALSKAYLFPENPARLPGFYTTVGGGGERQTLDWYQDKGIAYKVNTKIIRVDIQGKTLTAEGGTQFTFEKLIVATGCRPLTLKDFKMKGADHDKLYYLRNVQDADKLIEGMKKAKVGAKGGKVVALGGGYIGMETAAALQMNGLKVTMVFPEPHLMPRLFTQKIADFYTNYYNEKGIEILYGKLAEAIEGCEGECLGAVLKDGSKVECDMIVVGVGARSNIEMFQDQLQFEASGIKVDSMMKTSNDNVYAIGDVAAFPLKMQGDSVQRQEHVQNCRETAKQAVNAILSPAETQPYNYLPYFYSRVFDLSWKFFGSSKGDPVHFGDYEKRPFGAYWVKDGKVIGVFMEGADDQMTRAMKKVALEQPTFSSIEELKNSGIEFAVSKL